MYGVSPQLAINALGSGSGCLIEFGNRCWRCIMNLFECFEIDLTMFAEYKKRRQIKKAEKALTRLGLSLANCQTEVEKIKAEKEKVLLQKELSRTHGDLEDLETYVNELTAFLPLPFCTINPAGIVINTNAALENLSGYQSGEITGKILDELLFKEKTLEQFLSTLEEKERFAKSADMTLFSKEGQEVDVNVTASRRYGREENFIGFFLGFSDITELKDFQEKLEEQVELRTNTLNERTKELEKSESALSKSLHDVQEEKENLQKEKNKTLSIINNFSDGLIYIEKDETINLANPKFTSFFGIAPEQITGSSLNDFKDHSSLGPLVYLLTSEQEVFRQEIELPSDLVLEITATDIIHQEEKFGTLVIAHDVTRERMIEKMKTEFISVAAHQMRTPLAATKWSLEILKENKVGELNEEQQLLVGKGYTSTVRMIKLVNSMLNADNIHSGAMDYTFADVDFSGIIQKTIAEIKGLAEKRNIKLDFSQKDQKIITRADEEKMQIVFQNLIDNAVKYTSPGGSVNVNCEEIEKDYVFSVKDTGIGIPLHEQTKMFKKFVRAENAVKLETDGSGLGLFISKKIVEDHGGEIWFKSVENHGTTFFFTVPKQEKIEEKQSSER